MQITVVIPTFNRRNMVRRAVESALMQRGVEFEVIVVDDGSTDGTAEALREEFGDRIRLIKQDNAGVSAARNRGVQEATGEWIAFLDSDDVWLPGKLQSQIAAVSAHSPVLVASNWRYSSSNSSESAFDSLGIEEDSKIYERPIALVTRPGGHKMMLSGWMVCRRVFLRVGGFNPLSSYSEDNEFLLKIWSLGAFALVRHVGLVYTDSVDDVKLSVPGSVVRSTRSAETLSVALYSVLINIDNLSQKEIRQCNRLRAFYLGRLAQSRVFSGSPRSAIRLAIHSILLSRDIRTTGRAIRTLARATTRSLV